MSLLSLYAEGLAMWVSLGLLLAVACAAGRCPPGAIQGLQPDHCYVRGTEPIGWFEAEERCRRLGGHLASAAGGFQNALLADLWDGLLPHYYFWLGGSTGVTSSSSGDWDWTDGSTFGYINWEKCRVLSKFQLTDTRDHRHSQPKAI